MATWEFDGSRRPPFATAPGAGEESVWDYPRPPRLEPWPHAIEISDGTQPIARSVAAWRVCETAAPPTVYLPPRDVVTAALVAVSGQSLCEWKGVASYWALATHPQGPPVAWTYAAPTPAYRAIAGWYAFYPGRVSCRVEGETVMPQPGGFYGGWITRGLVGPFKGGSGTTHW